MAHADYNCCAICDCKLDYAGHYEATTKEEICDECLNALKKYKINNIDELKSFIKEADYKEVKKALLELGFSFCFYSNEIDGLVCNRFGPKNISFEDYIKRWE